jgi:hypothetical protein
MEFHRLGIKVFAADPSSILDGGALPGLHPLGSSIRLENLIPVFHGWIQKQNLDGHLLIDVHDYSHIHHGPGILLVAHEGNFSLDMGGGRPGLMYYRKTPTNLPAVEHLATSFRSALQACRLLEKDAGIRFDMNDVLVIANDRLNTANDEQTLSDLRPVIAAALKQTFEGPEFQIARASADAKERFAVTCRRP